MGQILYRLQRNQTAHARALCALSIAMAEQISMDRSWHIGWLITMLGDPPVQTISARRPDPDQVEPHTPLVDPSWFAAHLAFLKDADMVVERREKAQKTRDARAKKKGKGKGKDGKPLAEEEV